MKVVWTERAWERLTEIEAFVVSCASASIRWTCDA